jgi:hypothetical protein
MKLKIRRREISSAFKTSFPIMVTFIVLGIGFGLLMQKHGFGPLWSLASGIIIISGTVQFVSIALMSTGSVLMAGTDRHDCRRGVVPVEAQYHRERRPRDSRVHGAFADGVCVGAIIDKGCDYAKK